MLETIILVISFAVFTAVLPFSATARSSNDSAGAVKDSNAAIQARWPRKSWLICLSSGGPGWQDRINEALRKAAVANVLRCP